MGMFPRVSEELIDYIKTCKKAIICGHLSPDGDCANSIMAMGELLRILGKEYLLVNDGPYMDSNIGRLTNLISENVDPSWLDDNTLGIIVDCSTPDRLGRWQDLFSNLKTIVIDHHASGQAFGLARYIVPKSPSTTLLVYQVFKQMNVPLNQEIATLLFRGFITDSGFFRFLTSESSDVFSIVGELVSYGVSPNNEYSIMTGGQPLNTLLFLGKLLDRTETYFDSKLILTHEEDTDYSQFGCATPSNEFYQHALTVKDSSVVVTLKKSKKQENSIEVGFRSQHNSPVDVGKVALGFGGGGHAHAAGATIKGNLQDVKKAVIDAIGREL